MNLNDYQWNRNPRGMHDPGDNHQLWDEWQLGWIKLVFEGDGGLVWAGHALTKNIQPIYRIFRDQFSGQPMDETIRNTYQQYLDLGVKWFEFYNEPNLPTEWRTGIDVYPNNPDLIRPLCENWLTWAEFIIEEDGYPAFIALADTTADFGASDQWLVSLLQYMFDNHYERFRTIIDNGMWIATHPYIANHWYQEGTSPIQPRQLYEVDFNSGGWHFEYPYDPLQQHYDPGRTVWGATASHPRNDFFGVLGAGIAWLEKLQEMFGAGWIPVVGTEGGIWEIPTDAQPILQPDNRYPAYDITGFAHGTIAMFEWIAQVAPPWMFGLTLWRLADYWRLGNPIPALDYMANTSVIRKSNIPPIPALGDAPRPYDPNTLEPIEIGEPLPTETSEPTPTIIIVTPDSGPGPVHGIPTDHFVMLAPDFPTEWLFESPSLREYWTRFQPTLMTNIGFIDFLPTDHSLVITLIATPETASQLRDQLTLGWAFIQLDEIIVSSLDDFESTFRQRVLNGLAF